LPPHRPSSASARSSKSPSSADAPPGAEPLTELGYVARAHGLRGADVVRLHHPESEALLELDALLVRRRGAEPDAPLEELTLADARPLPDDQWLVTFDGSATRNDAEALRGAVLLVRRDRLAEPGPDEFFAEDLLDLEVLDPDGRPLGRVVRVYDNGAQAVLVVAGDGGEVDVPFVDAHVGDVDLERRTLVVRDLQLLVPGK